MLVNMFFAFLSTLVPDHPNDGEGHDAEQQVQVEHQAVNHRRYTFPLLRASGLAEAFSDVTGDGLELCVQGLHFSVDWVQQRIERITRDVPKLSWKDDAGGNSCEE